MHTALLTTIALSALLSFPPGFAEEATEGSNAKRERAFALQLPVIGRHEVPEEMKTPILVVSAILLLLYYGPTTFGRIRNTIRESKSAVKFLESERLRLENLKLRCEIEALKKEHGLAQPEFDIDPAEPELEAIEPGRHVLTTVKINPLILPQLENLEVRQRFMSRRIFAFFIDYMFFSLVVGFLGGGLSLLGEPELLEDDTIFGLLLLVVFFLYIWASWTKLGYTVGLKIVGLKVMSTEGRPLTPMGSLIRAGVWFITCLPMAGLGFWWLLISKRKLSLPDIAAKSIIVKVRGQLESEGADFVPAETGTH